MEPTSDYLIKQFLSCRACSYPLQTLVIYKLFLFLNDVAKPGCYRIEM